MEGTYIMKNWTKIIVCCLMTGVIVFTSGCSEKYDGEFNLKTDYQYTYDNNITSWRKVQSDSDGKYIYKKGYIYYYNNKTKTMTPLCNKPNCLHDMETDQNRLLDCNACTSPFGLRDDEFIQYYDGYVYYVYEDSLYRIKKDGSKKDKIFTADDGLYINSWIIHKGYLYYETISFSSGEGESTVVYAEAKLKSLKLSSNMSEKKAKVIYVNDDDNYKDGHIYSVKAYKNYLCYNVQGLVSDPESDTGNKVHDKMYLYNIETEENKEIPVPQGCDENTDVGRVAFLEDRILIELIGDDSNDSNDSDDSARSLLSSFKNKMPVYSLNYDLTDEKVLLDGVEQGKMMYTYGDYVIFSDAMIQYWGLYTDVAEEKIAAGDSEIVSNEDTDEGMSKLITNLEIYSSDGKFISSVVYPMNIQGGFSGFGPDGVNIEFQENEDGNSWSVYAFDFEDALKLKSGETIEVECLNTRKYGPLKDLDSFVTEN